MKYFTLTACVNCDLQHHSISCSWSWNVESVVCSTKWQFLHWWRSEERYFVYCWCILQICKNGVVLLTLG